MRNPIEIPCGFCHAGAGAPCLSVGKLPIVEPHMQRLNAIPADVGAREERLAYARTVVTMLFGRCDEKLLERARKERSIDVQKPWARRILHPRATS